jgi:hypothetical protein
MRYTGNACVAAVVAALVLCSSGCGGSGENAVVIRVGGSTITKATVEHWTKVVQKGGAFTAFRGEPPGGTARQRAVALLISCEWLIGEAAREGLPVSQRVVDHALAERSRGQAGAEFHKRLAETGQSVAGYELELRTELALEAIRRELERRINQITEPQIVAYYRSNRALFDAAAESREVDIIEKLPSAASAAALVRRIGTGRRFTQLAYHKKIVLSSGVLNGPPSKKAVDYAIFAARPGVVSRPMRLGDGWTVFIVRKITPAKPRPLSRVHEAVATSLKTQRKRDLESAFEKEYRRGWISRTSCRSGYVAPGCAEYHGRPSAYENPFFEG